MIINDDIKGFKFRLANDDGTSEIKTREEIWALAEEQDLDVMLISSKSTPATVKILDYGKYMYLQSKKQHAAATKQRLTQIHTKQIQLTVRIEPNDLHTKIKAANKFLESGDSVDVTLRLKGREMSHKNLAEEVVNEFVAGLINVKSVTKLQQTGTTLSTKIESSVKKTSH